MFKEVNVLMSSGITNYTVRKTTINTDYIIKAVYHPLSPETLTSLGFKVDVKTYKLTLCSGNYTEHMFVVDSEDLFSSSNKKILKG